MKPGRELDYAVARAMGYWTPEGESEDHFVDDEDNLLFICPHYSTDIAAAWQAWEWLEKNSGCGSVALFQDAGGPTVGVMRLYRDKRTGEIFDIAQKKWTGETYPHAICLAVLEASKATK